MTSFEILPPTKIIELSMFGKTLLGLTVYLPEETRKSMKPDGARSDIIL